MITTIIFDFSRTLLFPKDKNYKGSLNKLHKELSQKQDYQFLDHFKFNEELLLLLNKIKDNFSLYIFTTEVIQKAKESKEKIKSIFKKIYTEEDTKLKKNDPKAYSFITNDLGKNPSEILYIDDTIENINAAKRVGLKTIHYSSNKMLLKEIERIVGLNREASLK